MSRYEIGYEKRQKKQLAAEAKQKIPKLDGFF